MTIILLCLSPDEQSVIIDALENYRDEKGLDELQTDSNGNYVDDEFPKDAETANIISKLLDKMT
ncbi:MAG: hypothetical protein ABF624_00060 [Liquorilactobacillus ghanensis]|uniref:hypothetical protein n=1 Tax=Liquorilactobacillus ghanensis TaxID=399370 RepID=UPI0039E8556A